MNKFPQFNEIIIKEDEHLIFVNKPAGLSSLDERLGDGMNLLKMAKKYYPEAQLCHR